MTNHCINMLEFKTPAACAAARKIMDTADGDAEGFDFNAVRPRPACVAETAVWPKDDTRVPRDGVCVAAALLDGAPHMSMTDAVHAVAPYAGSIHFWSGDRVWFRRAADDCINEAVHAMTEGVDPADVTDFSVSRGKAILRCIRETGTLGWYSWDVLNWHTNWNAYDVSWGDTFVSFTTAWGQPNSDIVAILTGRIDSPVYWKWSEEQFDFITGEMLFVPGPDGRVDVSGGPHESGSEAAFKVASSIWDPDGIDYAWDPVGHCAVWINDDFGDGESDPAVLARLTHPDTDDTEFHNDFVALP